MVKLDIKCDIAEEVYRLLLGYQTKLAEYASFAHKSDQFNASNEAHRIRDALCVITEELAIEIRAAQDDGQEVLSLCLSHSLPSTPIILS